MLTSSSVVSSSPRTTTTNRATKPTHDQQKGNSQAFDDTPGDLPEDAIKGDHTSGSSNDATSTASEDDSNKSNVLKQPDKEAEVSSLLDRSQDPETTATAEQVTGGHYSGGAEHNKVEDDEGAAKHEQEQEEHDNQGSEEVHGNAAETEAETHTEPQEQSQDAGQENQQES